MSNIINTYLKIEKCSFEDYNQSSKEFNTIYFITDTLQIFIGDKEYMKTETVKQFQDLLENSLLPEFQNKIYEYILDFRKYDNYITPQMFGAIGDGNIDDTKAIQSMFDEGGNIYFPAGRYKVTNKLIVNKPCTIKMFRQYPNYWIDNDQGNHPLKPEENWMGSRIESYSSQGGLILGRDVQVDGLFLRAMQGFQGDLLTYDETIGVTEIRSYPNISKLSNIRLDVEEYSTVVDKMFNFFPCDNYNYILENIIIGRLFATFCNYGFYSKLNQKVEDSNNWANNVFIKNLCVDMHASYPLYIDGGNKRCAGWQFDGLIIQTYQYSHPKENYEKHKDIITLKNMQDLLFLSSYIWDLNYGAKYDNVFTIDEVENISCIGCSSEFDSIDTELSRKMGLQNVFNINSLQMSLETDLDTGSNTLTLSDSLNNGNKKQVTIPAANLSDEQVSKGIEKWMDENAAPTYIVGNNKFNKNSQENEIDDTGSYPMFKTHFIPATNGDKIRSYSNAWEDGIKGINWSSTDFFDIDKNPLGTTTSGEISAHKLVIRDQETNENPIAYIRNTYTVKDTSIGTDNTEDLINEEILMITVNTSISSYEPYKVTVEGGIGSYLVLSSPDGKKYTLSVDNEGNLTAKQIS